MSDQNLEALRERLLKDVRADAVRQPDDYAHEFPDLERAVIDTELAGLRELVETVRMDSDDESMTATVVASDADFIGGPATSASEARIGRYWLERELGRGGQGRVYLARDVEIGLEVALKVLNAGQAMSIDSRLRFKGEAEKAARLNHPNIARVHEWGEDGGVPFIAMELVRGDTLADHIRESARAAETDAEVSELFVSFIEDSTESQPTIEAARAQPKPQETSFTSTTGDRSTLLEIAELIESAARGLHEAHERGLVHRDVKPANLIVAENRGLVILDFGLAHDGETEGPKLTMTGDLLGTPAYMSPEQLAARHSDIDRRTDVYSLGVTLFECLALRRPFEATSREALFQEILSREAPNLRVLNRNVPIDLAVIVHHALEKNPDQRYQSAQELAEDLRRFREHEPIMARPVGPFTRIWRWAQRNPATAGLLVTIFVALTAIAIITSLNNRELGRLNSDLETTTRVAEANADQARENAAEARTNERLATEEAAAKTAALEREQSALAEKTKALSEYERMADTRRLANARAAADAMWPVHPNLVPALEAWRKKYALLFERLDGHREALESIRAKAPPYLDATRKRDFAIEFARIAKLEDDLARLRDQAAAEEGAKTKSAAEEAIALLETELAELGKTVRGRRSWDYGRDLDLQFRHDTLAKLVAELAAFTAEEGGVIASVARRLKRSRRVQKETLEDHAARWSETIARIASNRRYGRLTIAPQLGLIPLGPDPQSGLEEFIDWRTHDWSENEGALPVRSKNGRIVMTATRGLVFVLIPGDSFLMGAQRNPAKPNFDPEAMPDESPVRKVALSAYLISKYEMTQGQWSRFDGANPSNYDPKWFQSGVLQQPIDLRHPVEQVSWDDCSQRLSRLGLFLPTEAQWERAARSGAEPSTRWTGTSDLSELRLFANIAGEETAAFFPVRSNAHLDGFIVHAPVGSFAANAFGLFDTTGNIAEWCRDLFTRYDFDPAPGDGLRHNTSRYRILRGCGFRDPAVTARLADRHTHDPAIRNRYLGLRPARGITTE